MMQTGVWDPEQQPEEQYSNMAEKEQASDVKVNVGKVSLQVLYKHVAMKVWNVCQGL